MVRAMKRTSRLLARSSRVLLALVARRLRERRQQQSSATTAAADRRRRHDRRRHDRARDHDGRAGNITVFAAASLTAVFNEIGTAFTKANPDAKVTFSFDASSALVQQITQGAPADVFASADTANMDKLDRRRR